MSEGLPYETEFKAAEGTVQQHPQRHSEAENPSANRTEECSRAEISSIRAKGKDGLYALIYPSIPPWRSYQFVGL
ncbi:hypothetical protein I79_012233 [Cricetulus griseus]|uniref:Uncharacterized protein n=1 Tax=Cricetulus griseus TaxID=10029 RepID=G3HN96_CRIGR|nr:hypothetical protein I79_012233 [Cricetulus griseus]